MEKEVKFKMLLLLLLLLIDWLIDARAKYTT